MAAEVRIYETGIVAAVQGPGVKWTRGLANEIHIEANAQAPRGSTGTLARSHRVVRTTGSNQYSARYAVQNTARHALWVHEGTGLYGPRHDWIVPVNTPKKKYMHVPPHMGWVWTHLSRGVRQFKDGRVSAVDSDPYGHAERVAGSPPDRWLTRAAGVVLTRHFLV